MMNSLKKPETLVGWVVFLIASVVYFLSVERTGSLWDCGEFITGAYKLEVVHPPGAPLFMIVGRLFTWLAEIFSSNPEDIAFAVNMMSGLCTAFAAMFVCWTTITLGRLALVGRDRDPEGGETMALCAAGLVAGLGTAFCSSIWFSAVEGEVYAMSTMFTAMVLWTVVKWYGLPDNPDNDRWLVLAIFLGGLSSGVHLLSLLTFPALALFYYFKKYENHNLVGMGAAAAAGIAFIVFLQRVVIAGIPTLWSWMDLFAVNSLGLPFHSGLIFVIAIVGAVIFFLLRYSHRKNLALMQKLVVAASLVVISFSIFGVIVIRANANTPINMNNPSDAMRLLPYLNREQYGERPLLRGPSFEASPIKVDEQDRYGRLGDKYEITDKKVSYVYADKDKSFFPRMQDGSQGRPNLYRQWIDKKSGKPTFADGVRFLFSYQLGWMYWRYFMWNFSGRQNGEQGYYSWDKRHGHWLSGIKPLDEARLYNESYLPETMRKHQARNRYYMLPFIFGLFGLFFHLRNRPKDFLGLLSVFIITGIGIIIYTNQPPNEPRERDYVMAGSFFTYCIWMGMAVLAFYSLLKERVNLGNSMGALVAGGLVMIAPLLMGFQNFDDHSRRHHSGARDYASNFLESCEPNAIIFTYGDNDTYPLWYAQEVENIRRDVRVVNLSLIAVDWYIDQLRRKVNDSAPIKMTIPASEYRGFKRNQIFVDPRGNGTRMPLQQAIKFAGEYHPIPLSSGKQLESFLPSKQLFIPIDRNKIVQNNIISPSEVNDLPAAVEFNVNKQYILKGDLAVLDILASNIWERPIYFAVTVRSESLQGLDEYLQMEGLGLKIIPIKAGKDPLVPGVLGKGRVDSQKVYDNVMNKFRWGNFDKHRLYVDKSFGPSIQSHRYMLLRAIQDFIKKGDNAKAIELTDKYFEAFPHMNFPYDYNTIYFINSYMSAGANDKAKEVMKVLANETAEHLIFYSSLDPSDLAAGFSQEQNLANSTKNSLISFADQLNDQALKDELTAIFSNTGSPVKN